MDNGTQQQPNQGFPLFPNLPIELRLKIWKLATREPRIIEVRIYRVRGYPKHWRPITPQQGILAACHESREEGLKVYEIMKRQKKVYKSDDGNMSDIHPDASHLYEHLDKPNSYNRYGPRGSSAYEDATLRVPTPQARPQRDLIPTFRTYINHDLDTIYVHPSHSCGPDAVSEFIESLSWNWQNHSGLRVQRLQRIAFNIDLLRHNVQFDRMAKYVGWQEPNDPKVWVIAGDICCRTCNRETNTALKCIDEHVLQSHAVPSVEDLELFKEYINKCKEELDDARDSQQEVPLNPGVALGLILRE